MEWRSWNGKSDRWIEAFPTVEIAWGPLQSRNQTLETVSNVENFANSTAHSSQPGYLPPEQRAYVDRTTGEPIDAFQLLAHTNVWGDAFIAQISFLC